MVMDMQLTHIIKRTTDGRYYPGEPTWAWAIEPGMATGFTKANAEATAAWLTANGIPCVAVED